MSCSENTFLWATRVFPFKGLTCLFVDGLEETVKSDTANRFIGRVDSWMRLCKLSMFGLKVHLRVEQRGSCPDFSIWEAETGRFLWLWGQLGLHSEFQESQKYVEGSSLENKTINKQEWVKESSLSFLPLELICKDIPLWNFPKYRFLEGDKARFDTCRDQSVSFFFSYPLPASSFCLFPSSFSNPSKEDVLSGKVIFKMNQGLYFLFFSLVICRGMCLGEEPPDWLY